MLLTFIFTILSFLASVNVASLATSGDGSQANPWRGWETLIVTDATEYRFCKGWFAYSASPNWLKQGIAIVGEAGANLKHTGSGDAFVMDAGATVGGVWIQNVRVENLTIWGNVNTRHGFFCAVFAMVSFAACPLKMFHRRGFGQRHVSPTFSATFA
jgi:hypothetical protein